MAKRYRPKPKASDSDLDVLHPDRRIRIGGETWTVREYGLREAAELHGIGERYARSREAGNPDLPALVHLLSESTGQAVLAVAGLEDADFERLTEAWEALNLPLFSTDDAKPGAGDPARWADVYAALVRNGHRLDDIGRYTARQIRLFFEASDRLSRHDRAGLVADVSYGFAGGKPATEHIRRLRK